MVCVRDDDDDDDDDNDGNINVDDDDGDDENIDARHNKICCRLQCCLKLYDDAVER